MKAHFERGEIISQNFELVREVGRGAMGVVFLAVDCTLDRDVAIKLMLPTPEGEPRSELTTRFLIEGRAVAKLRGEHVAHVYEIGTVDEGNPFIVMEYLNGESLERVLSRRRKIPILDAARYLLQTCVGLSEAHSQGIVHRDLKPANLFAHRAIGGRLCVKVLDFGVAKLLFERYDVTRTNQLVGTPLYMAPEQLCFAKVDARSDIWSIGVILYQLLTGRVPFVGETVGKLEQAIKNGTPIEPYVLEPTVTPELSRIILRCLEKEPANRYADVGELAWDLSSFAEDDGVRLATEVDQFLAIEPAPRSVAVVPSFRIRPAIDPTIPMQEQIQRPNRWESLEFFDAGTFIQAVVHRALDGRPMTFLVGAGLNRPFQGRSGVPDAQEMVYSVRGRFRDAALSQFDRELDEAGPYRYSKAFSRLFATHGIKEVNRAVRRATLQARSTHWPEEAVAGDPGMCSMLEADVRGWSLGEGIESLARLLCDYPQAFGESVLTSNFDPLIEVAIRRSGGECFRTVLSVEGRLPVIGGLGCNVIHLHGSWWGEVQHAPHQLKHDRPELAAALTPFLAGRTLVVIGCGGTDDVLFECLNKIVTGGEPAGLGEDFPDVLWAFYSADGGHILRKYASLLDRVGQAALAGRFIFYKGVNAHAVLPTIHRMLRPHAAPHGEAEAVAERTDEDGDTVVSLYRRDP